jgi:hypothetical protein
LFNRDVSEWGDKVMTSNAGTCLYFVWAFFFQVLLKEGIWRATTTDGDWIGSIRRVAVFGRFLVVKSDAFFFVVAPLCAAFQSDAFQICKIVAFDAGTILSGVA